MLSVVLLALVLSVLPLPDKLRPFPALTSEPLRVVRGAVWPRSVKTPVAPVAPTLDDIPDEAPDEMMLPELDFSAGSADAGVEAIAQRSSLSATDEKEGRKWEVLIKKVDAAHVDIEEPCIERSDRDGVCIKSALWSFARAVRELREGRAKEPVRVVTLGTSLIASDHITDVARRRLQARHGSAGLGFMYVDRPTRGAGRTVRSGTATEGWQIEKLTDEHFSDNLGLAGVGFSAAKDAPQQTTLSLQGARTAELYLMTQPNGGDVEVKVDGKPVAEVSTAADGLHAATSLLELPAGKEISLRTRGGPVRLDGIALETGKPGMVFDSLGLPGGTAGVFDRANEEFVHRPARPAAAHAGHLDDGRQRSVRSLAAPLHAARSQGELRQADRAGEARCAAGLVPARLAARRRHLAHGQDDSGPKRNRPGRRLHARPRLFATAAPFGTCSRRWAAKAPSNAGGTPG